MEVIYERCCGLDVHKKTVVACLILSRREGTVEKTIRTFSTMTEELLALADWLREAGCTHLAMESSGVYWKPIYNLLEDSFELLLVNAQHIKAVPGRKTDVKDSEWIADLLRHGLLQASFVPDRPQRELRELTRYRTALVRERAAEVNRLQKILEGANIKLASVASNVVGRSGREMLAALLDGISDTKALADLAKGRLRDKLPQLEQALKGRFDSHQRFMVGQQLAHIDFLDATILEVSKEIGERLRPFQQEIQDLETIPGIGRRIAETLVAEIGTDMDRFPTAGHLASWAGMTPGHNTSAGKRLSGKIRKGSPWLRSILIEAAQAASHSKETYLAAQYRRLASRRGKKKATVAVGHTILVIAYQLLKRRTTYQDLGVNYYDERDRLAVEKRSIKRLESLGYKVTLEPIEPAA